MAHLKEFQALVLGRECPISLREDPLFDRMVRALQGVGEATGDADLAALVRQILCRHWDVKGDAPTIRVPATRGWPSDAMWARFSCSVQHIGIHERVITPTRWQPEWIDPSGGAVIEAAYQEEPRRRDRSVRADPLVAALVPGVRGNYCSPGQREAVRAAFFAPAGSTVLVNLPTGAGKTLAFQVPALRWHGDQGLSIVVVPTVALARDQERRMKDLFCERDDTRPLAAKTLAYHSGLSGEDRRAFLRDVADGSVPIVFTSPEAALGAMRRPFLQAAGNGRVKLFAVDEAHLVSQWGDGFRPHFQLLVGLRDALLKEATSNGHESFATMLLSATVTAEAEETLRQSFGHGRLHVVSEHYLRSEIGFLTASSVDEDSRRATILDSLRHLPRPLILYTTLRDDADAWSGLLHEEGYRRVRCIKGGDMSTAAGELLLQDWTTRNCDVVVATSAFGLGVDQSDVRSVVHACVPESIDRYYQEVGRAGRDGRAAVALLVSAPHDATVAESLATNPAIGVKRGLERWQRMFHSSRCEFDRATHTHLVPVDEVPPGYTLSTQRNVSWNLRTLVLMARAGLIRLACVPPPECVQREGETPGDFERRAADVFQRAALQAAVQIRSGNHLDPETWATVVEPVRGWLAEQDRRTISQVEKLVRGGVCLEDLFRDVYTIESLGVVAPHVGLSCPTCRRSGLHPDAAGDAVEPTVIPLDTMRRSIAEPLSSAIETLGDAIGRLFVAYEPPLDLAAKHRWSDNISRVLTRLAACGVVEFALPDSVASEKLWKSVAEQSPYRFVARVEPQSSEEGESRTRVTVLPPGVPRHTVSRVLAVDRAAHLIVFPRPAPDPDHPHRLLGDTHVALSLEALITRLQQ